jgi:hypothetical protein
MPWERSKYPPDWKAIRERIRARAGDRCEWCGIANHSQFFRDEKGQRHTTIEIDISDDDTPRMMTTLAEGYTPGDMIDDYKVVRVVCTTAHLGTDYPDGRPGNKHDKADCRDENLAFLCQRCHLNYDRAEHIENRRKNLLARKACGTLF